MTWSMNLSHIKKGHKRLLILCACATGDTNDDMVRRLNHLSRLINEARLTWEIYFFALNWVYEETCTARYLAHSFPRKHSAVHNPKCPVDHCNPIHERSGMALHPRPTKIFRSPFYMTISIPHGNKIFLDPFLCRNAFSRMLVFLRCSWRRKRREIFKDRRRVVESIYTVERRERREKSAGAEKAARDTAYVSIVLRHG